MPSNRRMRTYLILLLTTVVYILYLTSSARRAQSSNHDDFTSKTLAAMRDESIPGHPHARPQAPLHEAQKGHEDQQVEDILKAAGMDKDVKTKSPSATPTTKRPKPNSPHSNPEEKPYPKPHKHDDKEKDREGGAGESISNKNKEDKEQVIDREKEAELEEERAKEAEVEAELNTLLKKAPILIFSKSYCPYSKKAKDILLNKYSINPKPYVIELDIHPLGHDIQQSLAKMTGRKTVPNILVNGKSIGGGDDIDELDEKRELEGTLRKYGGKKIIDIHIKEQSEHS